VRWQTNGFEPPLDYADETFDLVFSISVFTHLDEAMQFGWLRELKRVTKPGGYLLLTVHGEHVYRTLPDDVQSDLRERGMIYINTGGTGHFKLDGLPDFYQTAYHTRAYVEREWSRLFQLVSYVPRGINSHQDAIVLAKNE
jgi:SAM-dependent methyltransferase